MYTYIGAYNFVYIDMSLHSERRVSRRGGEKRGIHSPFCRTWVVDFMPRHRYVATYQYTQNYMHTYLKCTCILNTRY